ncbi:MAG: hypothetical protein L3K08_01380, partial [Thermoplasmata archaeon]|nr:hypothetical protein [Thermoplasmata archaeon]
AGPVNLSLHAIDALQANGTASQNLSVAPPLSFDVASVRDGGDVGRPVVLNVTVAGGVAPYTLVWSVLPSGSPETATIASRGAQPLAVVPGSPGPLLLDASLTDAAGAVASGSFDLGTIGVGPSAALAAPIGPVEAGAPLELGLQIVGGAGPFDWSIEPSVGVGGAPADSGIDPGSAPVLWSGVPTTPGTLQVTAFVVDAFGGFAETNRSIPVLDALSLTAVLSNGSGAGGPEITVFTNIGGGVPPYTLSATAEGSTVALANVTTAGGYTLRLLAPPLGFDSVHGVLGDSLGINLTRSQTTFISPVAPAPTPPVSPTAPGSPSTSPSAGGLATALAGGVLVLGVAGGFWWLRRRTFARPPPPGGSEAGRALSLVRRSLADGEGMDPETLAVLGEEEGIAGPAVEVAVRQWERLGRIRRETDAAGGELVHWTPTHSVATPAEVHEEGP